jgi:organic hydroperoxide reductase OsmC/OhrA
VFCLITQIARFAPFYDVPLAEVQADVRAEFNAADKFVTDGGNGAFEQVTYALTVRSAAPPERVRLLIEHAERACHAAQSLRQPVPVSLEIHLNGRPLPLTGD